MVFTTAEVAISFVPWLAYGPGKMCKFLTSLCLNREPKPQWSIICSYIFPIKICIWGTLW